MSDSDSIEGSGSGIPCTNCTDDQEGLGVPLWQIFTFGLAIVALIFIVMMCITLLCKMKKRRKRNKDQAWNDILHEMTVKISDKTQSEECLNDRGNHIPTVNTFRIERNKEVTTTFINERGGRGEAEGDKIIAPQPVTVQVNAFATTQERALSVEDPTYDRLPARESKSKTATSLQQSAGNEPGKEATISERPVNPRSQNNPRVETQATDHEDTLTSSMGPGRRLILNSDQSDDHSSLYYIYVPEDSHAGDIYTTPSVQEESPKLANPPHTYCNVRNGSVDAINDKTRGPAKKNGRAYLEHVTIDVEKANKSRGLGQDKEEEEPSSPTYLKVIGPKDVPGTKREPDQGNATYHFIDDRTVPASAIGRESLLYQNVDGEDLVPHSQAEPTENVYTLPNEYDDIEPRPHPLSASLLARLNVGRGDEGTYCNIDDNPYCYDDVDIYTVPTDPRDDKKRDKSIYYSSIDDLRGEGVSEEGCLNGVGDKGEYSYASTHALVSPKRLTEEEKMKSERGEVRADNAAITESGYTYASGLKLVPSKPSKSMGSVKEVKPEEQSVPNPIYSSNGKSTSLPYPHSYENLKKLPPRRNSDKEYVSPMGKWWRTGSQNDLLDVDSLPPEEKDYLESSNEWVTKKKLNGGDLVLHDDPSSAYTPVMARLMYHHDYMLPNLLGNSRSQPTDSGGDWEVPEKWRASSLSTTKQQKKKEGGEGGGGGKNKTGKRTEGIEAATDKHKYQNWRFFNQ